MPSAAGRPPRVVVASDAFKGSLSSVAVGEAVRLGVLDVSPDVLVEVVGVADGGEGTVAAALAAGWRAVPVSVTGPTGEPVTATMAADGPRVLVELADACGLGRLPGGVPAPLTASSHGLGEAIRAALDLRPVEVVIGVGGSASTDGGAGMLVALGARVLDAEVVPVPPGGAALARSARLDLSGLDPRLASTRLVLAADVDSPLLGPLGAARVFAPQKGATPDDVELLETALTHWSEVVTAATGGRESTNRSRQVRAGVPDVTYRSVPARRPGAGAAGGVGFALLAVLGAERRSGVDTVLDLVGLDARLSGADLVVTGEGSLDAQTLAGKAVAGVARRAAAAGVPVVAVCGRNTLEDDAVVRLGLGEVLALLDHAPDVDTAMSDAAPLLRSVAGVLVRRWLGA